MKNMKLSEIREIKIINKQFFIYFYVIVYFSLILLVRL